LRWILNLDESFFNVIAVPIAIGIAEGKRGSINLKGAQVII